MHYSPALTHRALQQLGVTSPFEPSLDFSAMLQVGRMAAAVAASVAAELCKLAPRAWEERRGFSCCTASSERVAPLQHVAPCPVCHAAVVSWPSALHDPHDGALLLQQAPEPHMHALRLPALPSLLFGAIATLPLCRASPSWQWMMWCTRRVFRSAVRHWT